MKDEVIFAWILLFIILVGIGVALFMKHQFQEVSELENDSLNCFNKTGKSIVLDGKLLIDNLTDFDKPFIEINCDYYLYELDWGNKNISYGFKNVSYHKEFDMAELCSKFEEELAE